MAAFSSIELETPQARAAASDIAAVRLNDYTSRELLNFAQLPDNGSRTR